VVARWLKRSDTSQKVAGSIPDEVVEFLSIYLILPAALFLGFTKPLTEIGTRNRKKKCFLE
jgi:hypothetical protein